MTTAPETARFPPTGEPPVAVASRSLATALSGALFVSPLLQPGFAPCRVSATSKSANQPTARSGSCDGMPPFQSRSGGARRRLGGPREMSYATSLRVVAGVLTAATVMLGALLKAGAQENVDAFSCQYIEAPTAEPFGDEEGHGISVRDYACEVTQGPLSGGVLTARAVWEMDKSGGRLLLGGGVIRKPGALAVLQLSEGKLEYVTTNGEVTEVRASGRGNYILASGGAASLSDKTFTYITKTTAPSQFYFEDKRE